MGKDVQKVLFTHEGKEFRQKDITEAYQDLGVKKGDTIFIHSQLTYVGKLSSNVSRDEFTQAFIDAAIDSVGRDGNVLMPAFSYSFCKKELYDPSTSPSTVGILTEAFRKRPGVLRSLDPIFSICAYGPDQEFYTDVGNVCFGKNSIFHKLHERNAKIIFIGERFDITFMHYVERDFGVPYRYDKDFSGEILLNGTKVSRIFSYFVRDLNINPHYALEDIAKYFQKCGVLSVSPLGFSKLRMVRAKDAYDKIREGLKQDLSLLLTEKLPNLTKL